MGAAWRVSHMCFLRIAVRDLGPTSYVQSG